MDAQAARILLVARETHHNDGQVGWRTSVRGRILDWMALFRAHEARVRNACLGCVVASVVAAGLVSCTGVDDSLLNPPGPEMDAGSAGRDAGNNGDAARPDASTPGTDAGDVVICGGDTCSLSQRCCGNVTCGRCFERGTACPPIDCATDAGVLPRTDAGPAPVVCGAMTCAAGSTCCGNATCGRCIVIGTSCMPPSCVDAGVTPRSCAGPFDPSCGAGQFCDTPGCATIPGSGTCQPVPLDCGATPMPVCGCDRNTYDNPCQAHRARVSIATAGACDCRSSGCPLGQSCIECPPRWVCRAGGC